MRRLVTIGREEEHGNDHELASDAVANALWAAERDYRRFNTIPAGAPSPGLGLDEWRNSGTQPSSRRLHLQLSIGHKHTTPQISFSHAVQPCELDLSRANDCNPEGALAFPWLRLANSARPMIAARLACWSIGLVFEHPTPSLHMLASLQRRPRPASAV